MDQILIIEDDEMLNAGLCYHLQAAGFSPTPAGDLKSADELIKSQKWNLILLDVNLPDGNGFSFAEKLHKRDQTPIVFLTAHDLDEDMVLGFECGADDYITKPFNIKVVIQRIKAILRRCESRQATQVYTCGNLVIDFAAWSIVKKGELLSLTPTEFKLLQVFCMNPAQILTRQVLLEKLWDNDGNFVDEHTLTINISRLRAKIADDQYSYIKTIYGMGYQWMEG